MPEQFSLFVPSVKFFFLLIAMPDDACVCNCHELTRDSFRQSIADTVEVCKHKLHKFYEELQRKGRPKKFSLVGKPGKLSSVSFHFEVGVCNLHYLSRINPLSEINRSIHQ